MDETHGTTPAELATGGRVSAEHTGRSTPRGTRAAVTAVIVPPVAWVAALGLSYVVQDFTCTAYASNGAPAPSAGVGAVILATDAVLLLLTVAAGLVALRTVRHARADGGRPLQAFCGLLGVMLAVAFGAGIVLIAVNPLVLEVCP
ncbi:hypothetical protein [Xylanimonas oleitrophica]|uniref:hypothetical protein n=1 Tax=Xylanimonas oleitrophica TaxID=2607479 RepID=UPI0015CFDD49|nr:hypothetical protein [Xylanimonas oleitrophica]